MSRQVSSSPLVSISKLNFTFSASSRCCAMGTMGTLCQTFSKRRPVSQLSVTASAPPSTFPKRAKAFFMPSCTGALVVNSWKRQHRGVTSEAIFRFVPWLRWRNQPKLCLRSHLESFFCRRLLQTPTKLCKENAIWQKVVNTV